MKRWLRILRHRWMDETDAARALDAAALARIQAQIADSERRHRGEIRVCVEAGLPLSYLWRHATAHERAVSLFGKLRVWDTEDNNGVLVYLLLAEHRIEILADRGLNARVPPSHWQGLVNELASAFRAGRFEDGLQRAVVAVDAVLAQHFPCAPDSPDTNELPDAPVLV